MSSNIQPVSGAFTDPDVFTLITPVLNLDASGGVIQVNANANFLTNLPLGKALAVTEIDWNYDFKKSPTTQATQTISSWRSLVQITESLSRTTPAADPLNVDYDQLWWYQKTLAATAASISQACLLQDTVTRRVLRHPWLTVAMNLNIVGALYPETDNSAGDNGPQESAWAKLYFKLIDITPGVQQYLATRIQISSQA